MQSIMDALAKQVDMLGHEPPAFDPPALVQHSFNGAARDNGHDNGHSNGHSNGHGTNGSSSAQWRTWQIDAPGDQQDPWSSA
jgi:hypothetical protein